MSDPTTILVVSLGMSPPVVTETLWSLFRRDPPVVPGEIHLLTTRLGERSVRRGNNGAFLCDPDDAGGIDGERGGRLGELYDAFGHPRPTVHIHVPEPEPDDLRDEGSTLDYANLCVRVLAWLRQTRPDARLHVSLAGGRKTMGFFLGYALSLLGGPRDELSHVLVRPADFEGADFWWPGGPPGVLQRGGHRLSTADARVDLVNVPFVTLSAWVDPSLLDRLVSGELDYADLIGIVRPTLDPVLHLRRADRSATFGGRTVRLKPSEYALLEVVAHAFRSGWTGHGPEGAGGKGWLVWDDFLPGGRAADRLLQVYRAVQPPEGPQWKAITLLQQLSGQAGKPPANPAPLEQQLLGHLQNALSKLRRDLRRLPPVGVYRPAIPSRRVKESTDRWYRWVYVFGLAGVAGVKITQGPPAGGPGASASAGPRP